MVLRCDAADSRSSKSHECKLTNVQICFRRRLQIQSAPEAGSYILNWGDVTASGFGPGNRGIIGDDLPPAAVTGALREIRTLPAAPTSVRGYTVWSLNTRANSKVESLSGLDSSDRPGEDLDTLPSRRNTSPEATV